MRRLLAVLGAVLLVLVLTAATWPTDHGDNQRTGYNPAEATFSHLRVAFRVNLDGAVYGSPIVVGANVLVATENNTVYAFNATTGKLVWQRHISRPITDTAQLACAGNISPSGITGTPAYDSATRRVFVVTLSNTAPFGVHHEIVGLDIGTGTIVMHRRIAVAGTAENAEQQRAALATDRGNVYVSFGGLAGDCGQYKGAVISLKANGQLGATSWVVPTSREGGIWAAGGPVVAPDGSVYVSVGNGASTGGGYDGSDSVTRLSPNSQRLDFFAPTSWASDNASDLDLGSMTPAYLSSIGMILQAGKSGRAYLLRANHLGHIGGQVATGSLCRAFGVSAVTRAAVYMPCENGVTRVDVSATGYRVMWRAPVTGSPVVGPGALYLAAGSTLFAVSGHNGATLGSIPLGSTVTRFATPALAGNKVFVATKTQLVAVNVN